MLLFDNFFRVRPRKNHHDIYCFFKGTGKTKTIVAAIAEILKCSDKFVLVCAPSNTACDELTERILDVSEPNKIFRLYAKSIALGSISEKIRPVANLQNGKLKIPDLEYIRQFKVVICTLSMAGQLTIAPNRLPPNHFAHVIIDEAASCSQTASLSAIAGERIFTHRIQDHRTTLTE